MPSNSNGKTPMDFDLSLVAPFFPGTDLAAQPIGVVQTAIEALTLSNADCDFRHVEPTGMLGGGVKLPTVQEPSRFLWRKRLI